MVVDMVNCVAGLQRNIFKGKSNMDNKKIASELVKLAKMLVGEEHNAESLELFIDNDSNLYRQQTVPIIKNLMKKKAKGIYDSDLAAKLFMYLVENGAKKYVKENVINRSWHEVFSMNTRKEVAKSLRDTFEEEAELGNYDNYKEM
jgi:hypothetical protein